MRRYLSTHLASIFAVTAIIAITTASRWVAHTPNVTLLFGISIFSGFHFQKNKSLAFLIPITSLLLSDCLLGFHDYMWGTYLGTLMAIGSGIAASQLFTNKNSFLAKLLGLSGASVISSIVFYFISNFHVWLGSGADSLYPKTLSGLINCYVAALPFLKNSISADTGTAITCLIIAELAKRSASAPRIFASASTKIA